MRALRIHRRRFDKRFFQLSHNFLTFEYVELFGNIFLILENSKNVLLADPGKTCSFGEKLALKTIKK